MVPSIADPDTHRLAMPRVHFPLAFGGSLIVASLGLRAAAAGEKP